MAVTQPDAGTRAPDRPTASPVAPGSTLAPAHVTVWAVLWGVSLGHCINDTMQSMLSAIYPLLKDEFGLLYWQIGFLTFMFTGTAALGQPLVGWLTDRRPAPLALPVGMASSLVGVLLLAVAPTYGILLLGAGLIGVGSAIFHPEASRVARAASGGRFGTAQSVFQVGGNVGHAVGPLLAAFLVAPLGRPSVALFAALAAFGVILLWRMSAWFAAQPPASPRPRTAAATPGRRHGVALALVVLGLLVFAKNAYTASLSSFYTLYVIERFGLTAQQSQLMLFAFLAASAAGVMAGGLIGDRVGPLTVIWVSILGVLPFSLALPHVGLWGSVACTVAIGLILSSAFPAIVVMAQELVPGRVGLINGIFFGLAFGLGGIAAAVLGVIADARGLDYVYRICAWLPAMGLLTVFLPRNIGRAS